MALGVEVSEVDYVGGETCRYVTYYNKEDDFEYGYDVELYLPALDIPGEMIHKGQVPWEPIEYHSLSFGKESLEDDIKEYHLTIDI